MQRHDPIEVVKDPQATVVDEANMDSDTAMP